MPAIIDDPTSARIPSPTSPSPETLLKTLKARLITLRNGQTATILPFTQQTFVPSALLAHLSEIFNAEIEAGDTYPILEAMSLESFSKYWCQNFAAIMLSGDHLHEDPIKLRRDIAAQGASKITLGTFYIKPNYPGRSSHICNAGFLVSPLHRGIGVGRLLGEAYLHYAPELGYEYSVFNLVYETNTASTRIWDALGFERIGRVPGAGKLRSYPGRGIDAIVYGRSFEKEGAGKQHKGQPEVAGV